MPQRLTNLSPDIKKLVDEGYALEVKGAHLLVHHIAYVTRERLVKNGSFAMPLTLAGPGRTAPPGDHTICFIGETPCDSLGMPLAAIINNSTNRQLAPDILVNHLFSSKPQGGRYADFYEKIRTYAEILLAHARVIDPTATSRPSRVPKIPEIVQEEVFRYPDTNSARAKIENLNSKFEGQRIAIIGLGGTGSYVLDLVSKTPVREIHLFDGDVFHLHNAFRAPGAVNGELLSAQDTLKKVDYFYEIYSRMHNGIIRHGEYLTVDNIGSLSGFDFAFLCVDKNPVRHFLVTQLLTLSIPLVDAGLGVNRVDESLIASVRVTAADKHKKDHLGDRIGQDEAEHNEYADNIQIADLNCLNAVLAVIKWKKMLGFYQDLKQEYNSLYFINTGKLMNDDFAA
jgi:molybdopterin/thiamine biosynthesis adenylyltransferase